MNENRCAQTKGNAKAQEKIFSSKERGPEHFLLGVLGKNRLHQCLGFCPGPPELQGLNVDAKGKQNMAVCHCSVDELPRWKDHLLVALLLPLQFPPRRG